MIYIILALISFVYILFLVPTISTGDGAEFVVTSFTLGIPHPSGYPLYVQLLKLFSFIPLGNVAERMALFTVVFSIGSLLVLYLMVKIIYEEKKAAWFAVLYVAFIYSFLGQSVIIKFYTFNLFIIAVLLLLGVFTVLKGYDKKYVFLSAFLLGLSTANHHTGLFMVVPLFLLGLTYGRVFIKDFILSIPFFLMGFLVNIYMYIRSSNEKAFFFIPVKSLEAFWEVFLRKPYGTASSVETVKTGIFDFWTILYSIKNVIYLLDKNFTSAGFVLFILGAIYLYKKNKRLFLFIIVSFFMYSIFLAKLTLSNKELNISVLYVVGHQYFLPMFFLFALLSGLGIAVIYIFFRKKNLSFAYRIVPYIVLFFPLLFLFDRVLDQNFGKNYVSYSYNKTLLSVMPVGSFYVSVGDNRIFPSWYLKEVLGFRRDICNISEVYVKEHQFILWGCKPKSMYKLLFKEFYGGNLLRLAEEGRLFSSIHVKKIEKFTKFLDSKYFIFQYAWIPKDDEQIKGKLDVLYLQKQKYVNMPTVDCLMHNTDDYYSLNLCKFVSYNYALLLKIKEKTFFADTSLSDEKIEDIFTELIMKNNLGNSFYYVESNVEN